MTYDPTATGTEAATMTLIDSPDPLGPYTVSFTAAATIPESVSPTKLIFGNVDQTASKTLIVTVTNHATSGVINLNGALPHGSSDFEVTGGTCNPGPSGVAALRQFPSTEGRGSKVRDLIQRAISFARDSRF